MKLAIIRWPRVDRDLAAHYDFIARDKVEPAERLLTVAEASFERLACNPGMGVVWPSQRPHHQGLRFYPMPAPYRSYIIYYRVTGARLEVIAVLHGARDMESVLDDILD
jgi:toxin ParE1/3/4